MSRKKKFRENTSIIGCNGCKKKTENPTAGKVLWKEQNAGNY